MLIKVTGTIWKKFLISLGSFSFVPVSVSDRIRIGSAFDGLLDLDPHCECGSESRRGKVSPKKEEKIRLKTKKPDLRIRIGTGSACV
jgi:hypothetical protein